MTLYHSPQELIDTLQKMENVIRIKVKCLSCTESSFLPYVKPIIIESKLIIGESTFPVNMVEYIKFQYYFYEDFKTTEYWKVDRQYFSKYLTEEAKNELKRYRA